MSVMPHTAKFKTGLAIAAGALALAACADVPKLGPKAVERPLADYATAQSFAAPAGEWATDRWWDAYGDAQLSKLVDEAIANSPTLAQARARLETADSQVMQSRAAELPTLSANGQVDDTQISRAQGFPSFIVPYLPKG